MLHHHQFTPTKPKRTIILGASGFVARDLARHLGDHDMAYRAIGSEEINLIEPESVPQLRAAIREEDALVITSGLTPEKGKDVPTLMKNLAMGEHLAAALETASCAHVVYISSDAVYDWRDKLIRESSPRQPSDLYSLMHVAREQMLAVTLAKTRIPLCIFCPCGIYGAGDTHNAYGPNRFFGAAMQNQKISLFGQGEETRDHVHVEDISELLRLCLVHRSSGILNGVSGEAVTFQSLAEKISRLVGPAVEIESVPRSGPITHRQFDVTERIKAFPRFIPKTLDDGLAETFTRLTNPNRD
jgi:nucleoside-diphosphate-sugar epimerase